MLPISSELVVTERNSDDDDDDVRACLVICILDFGNIIFCICRLLMALVGDCS